MSNLLVMIVCAVLVLLLLGTNMYWYNREKALRESLRVSRQWDERNPFIETGPDRRIKAVAEKLDTEVDDVPKVIDSLNDKVRHLQNSLGESRESWAAATRDALMERGPKTSEQPLILNLKDGTSDDARALAKEIDREGPTVVCAHRDASFVVTAGEESNESAVAIAKTAMANIPGGAGGSSCFAQGGGQDDDVFDRIKSTVRDRADSSVYVVMLGAAIMSG